MRNKRMRNKRMRTPQEQKEQKNADAAALVLQTQQAKEKRAQEQKDADAAALVLQTQQAAAKRMQVQMEQYAAALFLKTQQATEKRVQEQQDEEKRVQESLEQQTGSPTPPPGPKKRVRKATSKRKRAMAYSFSSMNPGVNGDKMEDMDDVVGDDWGIEESTLPMSGNTARRTLWQRGHETILPSTVRNIIQSATVKTMSEALHPLCEHGFAIIEDVTDVFHPKNRCTKEQRDFILSKYLHLLLQDFKNNNVIPPSLIICIRSRRRSVRICV
jgi:hypothetical protein